MALGWRLLAKAVLAVAMLLGAFWLALGLRGYPPSPAPPAVRQPGAVLAARLDPPREPGDSRLIVPVAGVRPEQLADTFTQARAQGARRHDAIDIMAPRGTPVLAAAAGRVEKLFLSRDGGNTVYIRSPDGHRLYYYAHLDRYDPALAEGQALRAGARLGTVGSSGNANPAAPHLHFAVWMTTPATKWWEQAIALNPYPLLRGQ